jgi:hypothetical protein
MLCSAAAKPRNINVVGRLEKKSALLKYEYGYTGYSEVSVPVENAPTSIAE